MHPIQVDGLAVLPELTDDAIMVSNMLDSPVRGRETITRVLLALEDHFTAVSDIERINTASHRMSESRALLPTGERVRMTVVGTRDDTGWINEVVLNIEDHRALPDLVKIIEQAMK